MKPTVLATWPFSRKAVSYGGAVLSRGGSSADAVIATIASIEDDSSIDSVGCGGLPNMNGEVQCDASMMLGQTLRIGAVMGLEGYKNPIKVAHALLASNRNNVLCGRGAADFAEQARFEKADLLTEDAKKRWEAAIAAGINKPVGHDTVGCLAIDAEGHLTAGVSTSGLGFKHRGRVGDSPIVGSGFYADDEVGAAAATGIGEDIMKGVICYTAVEYLRSGLTPQAAAEKALRRLNDRLNRAGEPCGHFALIVLSRDALFGGACSFDFEYSVWQDGKVQSFTPVVLK